MFAHDMQLCTTEVPEKFENGFHLNFQFYQSFISPEPHKMSF